LQSKKISTKKISKPLLNEFIHSNIVVRRKQLRENFYDCPEIPGNICVETSNDSGIVDSNLTVVLDGLSEPRNLDETRVISQFSFTLRETINKPAHYLHSFFMKKNNAGLKKSDTFLLIWFRFLRIKE